MSEPWGIVVTGTLHLTPANRVDGPACRDQRVQDHMTDLRELWFEGHWDAGPIFGPADGRPVCRKCIKAKEREIGRAREVLAEVNDYMRSPR